MYVFGSTSRQHLAEAHPDLELLARAALEHSWMYGLYDFGISDCGRTKAEQRSLVNAGTSPTMRSRHIFAWPLSEKGNRRTSFKQPVSHAIDFFVYIEGRAQWAPHLYTAMWEGVWHPVSIKLGIPIKWGGHFRGRFDGPHIQLSWKKYPAEYADIG